MRTVELAGTDRRTTRLGFGCSSIMGGMGRKQSLQTLEWAYQAGVRHFDVAPMYGYGEAEGCLGEFLARHRGEVTVTTKFGIPPTNRSGLMGLARTLARPILKALPGLKARAQRAAETVAAAPVQRNLTPEEAQRSLDNSLRQLRVERVDVFLLHDARLSELTNDALLGFLNQAKIAGKIDNFGIGTDRIDVAEIQRHAPAYAPVVQQEWSVFNPVDVSKSFAIHHRALAGNRTRLQQYLAADSVSAARWSAEIGTDLQQPYALSSLMMRAALRMNPSGIVLFSSKDQKHIQMNAALAEPSAKADAQAEALYRLVQQELAQIALPHGDGA